MLSKVNAADPTTYRRAPGFSQVAQKVSSFHQLQNNVLGLTQQTDSQLLQNVGVIKLAER